MYRSPIVVLILAKVSYTTTKPAAQKFEEAPKLETVHLNPCSTAFGVNHFERPDTTILFVKEKISPRAFLVNFSCK